MDIRKNITSVKNHLAGKNCQLVAVSKTQPVEKIKEAYDAGQRIFGENKVQELCAKQPLLPPDIQWHLIGHLQTNKVKQVVPFVSLIHSVDSFKLLDEINKQAKNAGRVINCLLQVHIAKEETKFGFDKNELMELVQSEKIGSLHSVHIVGLMGMATFTNNEDEVRHEFRLLKNFFEKIKATRCLNIEMKELSMGMSQDYELAIEEGSTLVRVGSAIFGSRTSAN
ncbi:MAG: Pyridoxal phosphate-containing protein YggS [Cytophagales bacterium]|jgi:pyridoxal phosphate enzyme (YggS family)|nr:YggS family pyridoxal phosphate-dependent enzyme [Bacteroidota bacterium]WHZ08491.1 MAG: Pyridoxal phosphate-containing protein YggS [Cytophagales bacterium]